MGRTVEGGLSMPDQILFGMEVMLNGLMTGVMYALVALGFVLIYKASGIFNYAQGVMALFAAMTLVGIQEGRVPFSHLINAIFGTHIHEFGFEVPAVFAILLTVAVMVGFALLVQRFVFKHLVGQEPIILFMATIGLAYFLEGVSDLMWGSEIRQLDVGLPQGINLAIDETTFNAFGYGFFIDNLDIWASVIAAVLVAVLIAFSQYTKQGRAMRAVADDHQAALSVGISLNYVWVLVWSPRGHRGAGRGHHVGVEIGRAVFSVADCAQGAAGLDAGRVHLDPGRHHRRADHWHGRGALFEFIVSSNDIFGALFGFTFSGDRELVCLCAGADVPGVPTTRPLRRKNHREGVTRCGYQEVMNVTRMMPNSASAAPAIPPMAIDCSKSVSWKIEKMAPATMPIRPPQRMMASIRPRARARELKSSPKMLRIPAPISRPLRRRLNM